MSRRMQENLIAAIILLVFIATIVAASQYGPRARLVPIPIAALGAILICAQLVLQNFRSEKDLQIDLLEVIARKSTGDDEDLPKGNSEDSEEGESSEGGRSFLKELGALGIVLFLLGMFLVIGPIPTVLFFTAGYFILSGHFSPVRGIIYAFVFTTLVYALFHLWLGIDLQQGIYDLGFGLW
jgi:hypothetical protein